MPRNSFARSARQFSGRPIEGPGITKGGVVPIYGTRGVITGRMGVDLRAEPGRWNRLLEWRFPHSLNGTRVTITEKAAYLCYVSPTQINFQAPDDTVLAR